MKFIEGAIGYVPISFALFLVAAAVALALTPVARRLALRRGLVDRPGARRVNTRPVARGGGLAIAAAFLAIAGVFTLLDANGTIVSRPLFIDTSELVALFLGGAAAAAIGALDDFLDLRARWQLIGQVALATVAVLLGIGITTVANPFGPGLIQFQGVFGAALTIVWIVGMMNSINFIDGLDGLSTGIALIAALTLGVISLTTQVGQPYIAVLCFTLAGALLGFLRWNFHPATVFAGTGGVMFVGYTLAVLSILGSAKVAVAVLVLAVPIIDTFWIIVRRIASGRSPFTPDRGHIHHRLLDLGLSHRQTVLLIYAICAALAVLALVLSIANQVYAFLGVLVGFGLLLLLLTRGEASDALEAESYEAGQATDRGAPSRAEPIDRGPAR